MLSLSPLGDPSGRLTQGDGRGGAREEPLYQSEEVMGEDPCFTCRVQLLKTL